MRVARVHAQAKINLLLRVGPLDRNGYHQLVTVFQRIDLADEIVIRVGGRGRSVDCSGPHLPAGGLGPAEKNLAFRAAAEYADRADWIPGFSIEVTKNIPVGGGLGGGSADAGAVLRALDALAPKPLGPGVLPDLSVLVGSDVTFLTGEDVIALGTDQGEQLWPLEPLPSRDVLLAVPDFGVKTAEAYRWIDEAGGGTMLVAFPPTPPYTGAVGMVSAATWDSILDQSHNDFEVVVEQRHPKLRELRRRLSTAGARIARLSGSGSAVFGIFDGAAPAPHDLALDALVIPTRTSSRVVQVEVLE